MPTSLDVGYSIDASEIAIETMTSLSAEDMMNYGFIVTRKETACLELFIYFYLFIEQKLPALVSLFSRYIT